MKYLPRDYFDNQALHLMGGVKYIVTATRESKTHSVGRVASLADNQWASRGTECYPRVRGGLLSLPPVRLETKLLRIEQEDLE